MFSYLKDFDETERAKSSSARHQAKRRIMQQNFIIISVKKQNKIKKISISVRGG